MTDPVPNRTPADSPSVRLVKVGVEIVKQLVVMAMHGSKGAMALLVVIGLVVSAGWFVWSGWLNRLTPAPPVISPVTVSLDGPTPEAVAGSSYIVAATIAGPAGKPTWEVTPLGTSLTVNADGRTARFSPREAGHYAIRIVVPGDGMQVAKSEIEVDVLAISDSPEPAPSPADPPHDHVPTVGELTAEALANVASSDRVAEAHIIAGSIKSVIARIETGLLSPDADALAEVETQARAALGAKISDWDIPFFGAMAVMFDSLRQQGAITTAASALPTLKEMAAVLQNVR